VIVPSCRTDVKYDGRLLFPLHTYLSSFSTIDLYIAYQITNLRTGFMLQQTRPIDDSIARLMSPTQLYGLPTELLVAVATHLSALEIVRLGRVDRYLYDFVKRHGKFVATAIARRETVRLLEEHEHLNFKDVPLDVAMRRYNEKFGWPWDFFPPQGRPYGSWHVFVHFCKGFARANPGMWMDGYLGELHVGWVADVLIQVSNSMEWYGGTEPVL